MVEKKPTGINNFLAYSLLRDVDAKKFVVSDLYIYPYKTEWWRKEFIKVNNGTNVWSRGTGAAFWLTLNHYYSAFNLILIRPNAERTCGHIGRRAVYNMRARLGREKNLIPHCTRFMGSNMFLQKFYLISTRCWRNTARWFACKFWHVNMSL